MKGKKGLGVACSFLRSRGRDMSQTCLLGRRVKQQFIREIRTVRAETKAEEPVRREPVLSCCWIADVYTGVVFVGMLIISSCLLSGDLC